MPPKNGQYLRRTNLRVNDLFKLNRHITNMVEMKTATEQVKTNLEGLWSILLTPACFLFLAIFLGSCVIINRLGWNDERRWGNFRFRKTTSPLGAKEVKKLKRLGLGQDGIKQVEETGNIPFK